MQRPGKDTGWGNGGSHRREIDVAGRIRGQGAAQRGGDIRAGMRPWAGSVYVCVGGSVKRGGGMFFLLLMKFLSITRHEVPLVYFR